MPKLKYERCIGCDNAVPLILDTAGLYVSKCWWCGCAMTQVQGVVKHAQTVEHANRQTQATANAPT